MASAISAGSRGLFDIGDGAEADGGLEVLLVGVAAHEYDRNLRKKGKDPLDHGDAVHARHAHVGEDDVGVQLPREGNPLLAVGGLRDLLHAEAAPVHGGPKPCPGQFFVINN